MPSVDIPTSTNTGDAGSKQGFGTGLPTPVLLALVGGGIGLVVFMMRKSGSNTGTGADKGTLLPNTAIMLGSLQQGVLQLQGDVTQGNADMSSQLTGVGESLGTQIDAQSAGINKSFADLNTFLSGNFQTLQGSESALSQAIAGLGTQNADLATSLTHILGDLQNVSTGITNTQNQIASNQASVSAGLGSIGQQLTGISGQINTNTGGLVSIMNGVQAIQNGQNSLQAQLQAQFGSGLTAALQDPNVQNNNYVWYQGPGTNQYQAAILQKTSSGFVGISWADFMQRTGLNYFPGVGGAPGKAGFLAVVPA